MDDEQQLRRIVKREFFLGRTQKEVFECILREVPAVTALNDKQRSELLKRLEKNNRWYILKEFRLAFKVIEQEWRNAKDGIQRRGCKNICCRRSKFLSWRYSLGLEGRYSLSLENGESPHYVLVDNLWGHSRKIPGLKHSTRLDDIVRVDETHFLGFGDLSQSQWCILVSLIEIDADKQNWNTIDTAIIPNSRYRNVLVDRSDPSNFAVIFHNFDIVRKGRISNRKLEIEDRDWVKSTDRSTVRSTFRSTRNLKFIDRKLYALEYCHTRQTVKFFFKELVFGADRIEVERKTISTLEWVKPGNTSPSFHLSNDTWIRKTCYCIMSTYSQWYLLKVDFEAQILTELGNYQFSSIQYMLVNPDESLLVCDIVKHPEQHIYHRLSTRRLRTLLFLCTEQARQLAFFMKHKEFKKFVLRLPPEIQPKFDQPEKMSLFGRLRKLF